MRTIIIDNYDSFTYNLRQICVEAGSNVEVVRNDKFQIDYLKKFDKIILSPGPGLPKDAGLMPLVIKEYASTKSILGVCLGHQAIGEAFGCNLKNLSEVFHGVSSEIEIVDEDYLFNGLGKNITVGRYHSWVIDNNDFSKDLIITALSKENQIMAVKHGIFDVHGIQFHPESILTPNGEIIINNFLKN